MIYTLIYFIVALGILVFVHELGHFLVAKQSGIRVERFSLGFPPKMVGVRIGETEYCLSWIPFGGYVKVAGMADVGTEATQGEPWEFPSKPIWVRMAVIGAGPAMNFAFAFIALAVLFFGFGVDTFQSTVVMPQEGSAGEAAGIQSGDRVLRVDGRAVDHRFGLLRALDASGGSGARLEVERGDRTLALTLPASPQESYGLAVLEPALVGRIEPGMPAEAVGLQAGDRIVMVGGEPVRSWAEMSGAIRQHPGEQIRLAWEREGRTMEAGITPEEHTKGDQTFGQIGIGLQTFRARVGLGESLALAGAGVYRSSGMILVFIRELIQGLRSAEELGGPLRIMQLAGRTAQQGPSHFISFLAMLSVNLAIINLLPIPVLDGGHLIFLALEAIMRRPLSLRQREIFQQIGLAIMLFIMVLVTFNDLNQMVFHRLAELF